MSTTPQHSNRLPVTKSLYGWEPEQAEFALRPPAGFTREAHAEGTYHDLHLLIEPGADLDGTFKAWCLDCKELIQVNGWLFLIEDA